MKVIQYENSKSFFYIKDLNILQKIIEKLGNKKYNYEIRLGNASDEVIVLAIERINYD